MIEFSLVAILAIVMAVEVVKHPVKVAWPEAGLKWLWVLLPLVFGAAAGAILAWGRAWNVIVLTAFVHAAAASYGYQFARELLMKQITHKLGGKSG